jgi:hypothetical protein
MVVFLCTSEESGVNLKCDQDFDLEFGLCGAARMDSEHK